MLEDAADRKARQSIQRLDLTDGLLETRAYRKADAAHTGVDFNMNFYPHPGLHSSGRKRLGVLRGEAGGGNIILRQRCSVGRVGITQNQDGYRNAMVAQMMPLAQAAYRKTGNACLLYRLGGGYVTVAVGIGLDNGADRPADRLPDVCEIVAQCIQIDLSPAMFFKLHIHSPLYSLFSLSYPLKIYYITLSLAVQ